MASTQPPTPPAAALRSCPDPLYERFRDQVQRRGLIRAGDSVILAFSGGKDSSALLHLLLELRHDIGFELRAAYFNHQLQRDAAAEENWVRAACARLGVELVAGGRDVRQFRDATRLNLEHAASLSRYRFLADLADRRPGALIATAHTRSDLVETFFIKLFRGSGLQGLGAVYQRKHRRIVRPLLLFGEAEVRAFLQRQGIGFFADPSNHEPLFLRNRIRLQLLPRLRELEPALEERVLQTVTLLQEEFDFFAGEAQRLLDCHLRVGRVLPSAAFAGLHLALRRHLAREYLRRLKGDLLGIGFDHVESFLRCLESGRGLSLPGGDLRFDKGWVRPRRMPTPDYRLELSGPGRFPLPALGGRLTVSARARFRTPAHNREMVVARAALAFPLVLRQATAADRFRKLNAAWKQDAFEAIRVAGYPADLRFLCPLLENGDGRIVWVAGAPLAHEFRVAAGASGPFLTFSLSEAPDRSG